MYHNVEVNKTDLYNFLCNYDRYSTTAFWSSNETGNASNSAKQSDSCQRDITCDAMVRRRSLFKFHNATVNSDIY